MLLPSVQLSVLLCRAVGLFRKRLLLELNIQAPSDRCAILSANLSKSILPTFVYAFTIQWEKLALVGEALRKELPLHTCGEHNDRCDML